MLVMERWQSWSIASDLKSDEVQASVGSNPTFSDYVSTILSYCTGQSLTVFNEYYTRCGFLEYVYLIFNPISLIKYVSFK